MDTSDSEHFDGVTGLEDVEQAALDLARAYLALAASPPVRLGASPEKEES